MRLRTALPIITLALSASLLSACQTMTPQERRMADERTCADYGFRPKTEAMARCLLDLDLNRRADRRAFEERNGVVFYGASWRTGWGPGW